MNKNRNKVIIFGVIGGVLLIILIFVFSLILKGGGDEDSIYNTQATLDFWGVNDRSSAYRTAIDRFQTLYPNVEINYRRFSDSQEYEDTLLNALAAGEGPDIFTVRNNDLPRKANKIFPLPDSKYSVQSLQKDFPEVVKSDFVYQGRIYALPVSVDTLSLIYNKELFNEAAVVFPPETWEEFQETVPKLTKFDGNEIIQSGAAIGTSYNIENSADILSLLMLQSGAEMVNDDYTKAVFNSDESEDALNFYLRFSDSNSQSYTWDDYLPEAVEAFTAEKSAIIFGYSRDLEKIKSRNSLLEIETAPIPQVKDGRKMSLARYFGYTVSRQTERPGIAWDFVRTLAVDLKSAESYLEITGYPPGLKYLIDKYKDDSSLGVFAKQALIARSWSEPHPEKVSGIFDNMVETARDGRKKVSKALYDAQKEVTNLMKRSF